MPTAFDPRTFSRNITAQLEKAQSEAARLQAEQKALEQAAKDQQLREKQSRASLAAFIGREVQRRTVLGGLTPELVYEYASSFDDPSNVIWELTHSVLTGPVYGLQQTSEGFSFNGKSLSDVTALHDELKSLIGDFGDVNGPDFLDGLVYAMATDQEHPVSYALSNVNAYPTDLEKPEADRLFRLTKYHHNLGSLMNGATPQRPNLAKPENTSQEAA